MFKFFSLSVAVFCVIVNGVSAQNTATFTYTATPADCTGKFTCAISASDVDTILAQDSDAGSVSFKKGGVEQFKITGSSSGYTIADSTGTPISSGITTNGGGASTSIELVFSTNFPLTSAQTGDWTCTISSPSTTSTAAAADTIANTDLGACGTTISMDPCARTVTCDLGQSVADIIANSGTINFKKGGTTMYKIAATDTVTDNAAAPAAVTGLTASAPVGTNAGGDANDATLTFGSTFVTFDSTTLDGDWTCDVTDAGNAWFALASASTTLSTSSTSCNTLTFSYAHTSSNCQGTITCDIGATVATVQGTGGIIKFLKGGAVQFQISTGGALTDGSGSAVASPTASTTGTTAVITFSASAQFDANQDGSWSCQVESSSTATDNGISSTVDVQISDQTQCTTKYNLFRYNHCNKQLICELTNDVNTVQGTSGVVTFVKDTVTQYSVATDDALTTGAGTAVTSATASVAAPGTSSNQVVLTLVTYDAATIDGLWKCNVASSTVMAENGDSGSYTLTYACSGSGSGYVELNAMLLLASMFIVQIYQH